MELLKGVIAEDLFLYLPDYKTFILSDIHIGYEESLNRQGILIPRNNYTDLIIRIERAIDRISKKNIIKKIIINGDIIHEFGKISRKEKALTNKFIKFMSSYGKITLIEGNHDKALKYFIDKDIEISEHLALGEFLILHGDTLPSKESFKGIKTIIIGHEHPSIALASGSRSEKYKCFLKGKYAGMDLIVMPSCNIFIEGTDVSREKLLSPFLKKNNILNFEVFVVEDKIYDFGKIRTLLK
ncbi:MAG: metallophosphoesterase [Candidatus Woesearchaeota archaeon]